MTNGLGALPALAAKWQHQVPMIVTEHGIYMREQYLHLRRPSFGWPVKDLFLRFLSRVCALGYREAELITPGNVYNKRWEEELGADGARVRTVYNGVNPDAFPALTSEPDVPTISWVGRVDPVKDLETLLHAFALVVKQMPEARLRMFGAPPKGREAYLERCRVLAASLGIGDRVTFEGRVPDIIDAYAAGHVVVLCSISEGFPYSSSRRWPADGPAWPPTSAASARRSPTTPASWCRRVTRPRWRMPACACSATHRCAGPSGPPPGGAPSSTSPWTGR